MSDIEQYDYSLPRHLVAQRPLPVRSDARLMLVDRRRQEIDHYHVRDLPELLAPHDCVVMNDTRVLAARLLGWRDATGGRWEGLFLEEDSHGLWRLMAHTRGKPREGETVTLINPAGEIDVRLRLVARLPDGGWIAKPESDEATVPLLERVGRIPLPRYIRQGEMTAEDRQAYQTVYAAKPGAVAAPTAGLHFTPRLLDQLRQLGVNLNWVTLHVGAGTFRPIATDCIDDHPMHAEWGEVNETTVAAVQQCRSQGGRVVAVGSTSLRLLETAAQCGTLGPYRGSTDLFIRPPYQFQVVNAMLTNFHLPRTTLLVLVRTFGGDALMRRAYDEAIREEYRFYSYGDAMLIV